MLDTSDRQVFNSSYDASLGTVGFEAVITDMVSAVLSFDKRRRQLFLLNGGDKIVYVGLTLDVSPDIFSIKLLPKGVLTISDYGGLITAICDPGNTSNLYVTDIH